MGFLQSFFQHKFSNQFTRINNYEVCGGTNLDGVIFSLYRKGESADGGTFEFARKIRNRDHGRMQYALTNAQ